MVLTLLLLQTNHFSQALSSSLIRRNHKNLRYTQEEDTKRLCFYRLIRENPIL